MIFPSCRRDPPSQAHCLTLTRLLHPSIRRVKCDETRPSCNRCTISRRRCDGYLPANVLVPRRRLADLVRQTPSLGPAAESIAPILRQSPEPATSVLDTLFFDVFRHATGPGTALLLPSLFWTRDLPQMAHAESAIWHATLALGALHRQWETDRAHTLIVASKDVFKRSAYRHYMRAISLAKSITSAPTLRALSVVLVAVSNLLGRWSDSRTHLFGGLHLLDHEHNGGADIDGAAEILGRLDLQAMTFSESQAPYPFESPVWLRSLHQRLLAAETIASYGRAGTLLLVLLRRFILLCVNTHDGDATSELMRAEKARLTEELEAWEAKMGVFERTFAREDIPALSVRIYHAQLRLWLARDFDGDEMRWDTDECLFYFEYIINLAEELIEKINTKSTNSLSLEPAVIVPLFSAAHRCRHRHLRRRAIGILRCCRRQEGMWPSDGAAAVAVRIADAEEGQLDPGPRHEGVGRQPSHGASHLTRVPDIPWDTWSSGTPLKAIDVTWDDVDVPPRSRRVQDVLVEVSTEKRRVNIALLFVHGEEMVTVDDTIMF